MKTALLIVVLLGLFGVTAWFAFAEWQSQTPVDIGVHGWIALVLGFVFTVGLGAGLMALSFYSSRKGYDDLDRD